MRPLCNQRSCYDPMLGPEHGMRVCQVFSERGDVPSFVPETYPSQRKEIAVPLVENRVIEGIVWITRHIFVCILRINVGVWDCTICQSRERVIRIHHSVPGCCGEE